MKKGKKGMRGMKKRTDKGKGRREKWMTKNGKRIKGRTVTVTRGSGRGEGRKKEERKERRKRDWLLALRGEAARGFVLRVSVADWWEKWQNER